MAALVSIIVPVHNSAPFLPEFIVQLQLMKFTDWECICVNNQSWDNSMELLDQIASNDPRFLVYDSKEKGVSHARNFGLNLAGGRYIQFLDADDLLEPRKISEHVAYLELHPEIDCAYSDARYFHDLDPSHLLPPPWHEMNRIERLTGTGKEVLSQLLKGNCLVISAPIFRKNDLLFNIEMPYNEDWDFWLRMAEHGKSFAYVHSEGTYSLIRLHPTSGSTNLNGMYGAELSIYSRYAKAKERKIRRIAILHFYKTWFEIFRRRLRGDQISITNLSLIP